MYLVIELQTNDNGTVGNFVWKYSSLNEAQAKYYSVLSVAAVSNLPCHACAILLNDGSEIESKAFIHEVEPPETEEPEEL